MASFNGVVAGFFRDHYGIASCAELAELGVGHQERRHLLETGALVGMYEGVYRLASSPVTFLGECRAVCLADDSLILSCFTSGRLFELRRCRSPRLHAMTNRLTKPVGADVVVHRTTLDLTEHTIHRSDGIRHTDVVQTFFDLAKHINDLDLRSIGEQIIADGLATHEDLMIRATAIAANGRPGSGRALRVLGSRVDSGTAAESHGEVILFDALHAAGFTDFVRHPPVRLRSGTVVHPDMGCPKIGFYVEVDHHTWHTKSADVEYDHWRDMEVRLTGAEVERIPTRRIETALLAVVADLAQRHHQRRVRVGDEVRQDRTRTPT